jgi:insertion element IS1 protein InsB
MENLWCERLSFRGICRAVGVSLPWLLPCMVEGFTARPDHLHIRPPTRPTDVLIDRLEAEADETGSFGQKKANKHWSWMAMDATTRQIIAFHVGEWRRASAKALWANIPALSRDRATFPTDP